MSIAPKYTLFQYSITVWHRERQLYNNTSTWLKICMPICCIIQCMTMNPPGNLPNLLRLMHGNLSCHYLTLQKICCSKANQFVRHAWRSAAGNCYFMHRNFTLNSIRARSKNFQLRSRPCIAEGEVVRGWGGDLVRWWGGEVVRWWGGEVVRWWGGEVVRWGGGEARW